MAQRTMKRLGHAQGMLRDPSRQAAGGVLVQNPSGDAWVMAEGSPGAPRVQEFLPRSPQAMPSLSPIVAESQDGTG